MFKINNSLSKINRRANLIIVVVIAISVIAYSFISSGTLSKILPNNSTQNLTPDNVDFTNPIFKINTVDGKNYDLSKNKSNLILYFFNSNCAQCILDIKNIEQNLRKYNIDTNLFLKISEQNSDVLTKFGNNIKVENVVSDENSSLANYFRIFSSDIYPDIFIFNNQKLNFASYSFVDEDTIENVLNSINTSQSSSQSETYNFTIDKSKIQNSCSLSNPDQKYQTSITDILKSNLKQSRDEYANCIDTINPRYEPMTPSPTANYSDDSAVFNVAVNGKMYSYPRNILTQHPYLETYYDFIPIGIFYDGLTDNIHVFSRLVNGSERKFIVSGRSINNHLLLFDTIDYSLWDGEKSVGSFTNSISYLHQIPISRTIFGKLKNNININLLSEPQFIDYSKDVLENYRNTDKLIFPIDNLPTLYPIKKVIIQIDDFLLPLDQVQNYYNGETKSGKYFVVIFDKYGAVKIYNRKINRIVYHFKYVQDKLISFSDSEDVVSNWNDNLIATEGKLKNFTLVEMNYNSGYYFYLNELFII